MQTATVLSLESVTPRSTQETKQCIAGPTDALIDELAHELRQPLSAIEHLAFLLQMNATDSKVRIHLQQILDLVVQANRVLEEARAGTCSASL